MPDNQFLPEDFRRGEKGTWGRSRKDVGDSPGGKKVWEKRSSGPYRRWQGVGTGGGRARSTYIKRSRSAWLSFHKDPFIFLLMIWGKDHKGRDWCNFCEGWTFEGCVCTC